MVARSMLRIAGSVAWGLFPNLLIAAEDPSYSLTIYNSTASSYGLHVGLVWFGVGISLVVAYWLRCFHSPGVQGEGDP